MPPPPRTVHITMIGGESTPLDRAMHVAAIGGGIVGAGAGVAMGGDFTESVIYGMGFGAAGACAGFAFPVTAPLGCASAVYHLFIKTK